jgi:hypothetical protein
MGFTNWDDEALALEISQLEDMRREYAIAEKLARQDGNKEELENALYQLALIDEELTELHTELHRPLNFCPSSCFRLRAQTPAVRRGFLYDLLMPLCGITCERIFRPAKRVSRHAVHRVRHWRHDHAFRREI